jgi:hypothetical protein
MSSLGWSRLPNSETAVSITDAMNKATMSVVADAVFMLALFDVVIPFRKAVFSHATVEGDRVY